MKDLAVLQHHVPVNFARNMESWSPWASWNWYNHIHFRLFFFFFFWGGGLFYFQLFGKKNDHSTINPFYPRPVLVIRYCRCLRLCVCVFPCVSLCANHLLVRAITLGLFKLWSPNLDQRCKRPWSRSYCFGGHVTLTFKAKFNLKFRIYTIFSLSAP